MAQISSILSILVNADTGGAASNLKNFEKQMDATRLKAARDIKANLGADFDMSAFAAYDAAVSRAQARVKNKAAFKLALGGDFNAAAFNQYQRAVEKGSSDTKNMANDVRGLRLEMNQFTSVAVGAGPAMLGLGTKVTLMVGAVSTLSAAMPGLLGAFATLGGAGVGLMGVVGSVELLKAGFEGLMKSNTQFANQVKGVMPQLQGMMNQIAQPLLAPAQQVLKQVPALIKQLEPSLKGLFSSAAQMIQPLVSGITSLAQMAIPQLNNIIKASAGLMKPLMTGVGQFIQVLGPELTQTIKAVQPLMAPLLKGIGTMLSGIGTGINVMLKAVGPVVGQISGVFATLGKSIGSLFTGMAPAIKAGTQVFAQLMNMVASLLPTFAQVASMLAVALAPAFAAFAKVIAALMPALMPIVKIFGQLAAAIVGDLAAALGGLATLLKGLAPSFAIVSQTLGQLFNTLENAGVFGAIAAALEQVAPLLANLVNQLVKGLAPVLPTLVNLFASLMNTGIGLLVTAFQILVPLLVTFINTILKPLVPAMQTLAPVVALIAQTFAGIFATGLQAIAPLLQQFAPEIVAIVTAIKLWTLAQVALDAVMDANPVVLIGLAIAALATGIVILVDHTHVLQDAWNALKGAFSAVANWLTGAAGTVANAVSSAWDTVKNTTTTVWNAIGDFLKKWWPEMVGALGGPMGVLVALIVTHWSTVKQMTSTVWNAIKGVITGAWNGIKSGVSTAANTVKSTTSNTWNAIKSTASTVWNGIKGAITGAINGAVSGVKTALTMFKGWLSTAWDNIVKGVGTFATNAKTAISNVFKNVANTVIGFIDEIIGAIDKIPGVNIPKVPKLAQGGSTDNLNFSAAGHQGYAVGGKVTRPMYMVGEEAPRHPEFVLATNPAYRQRNLGLFAAAGKALNVPGFAQGGIPGFATGGVPSMAQRGAYSFSALEQLWDAAGGPASLAPTAAAIALAESSGNPMAHNASGASGLWQILGNPFPGNAFDPLTNARMAVAKWRGAPGGGDNFSPWVTYETGAYKQFLSGGGGGLLSSIGGAITGALGAVGGFLGDLLSKGANAVLSLLPKIGSLPGWLSGTGKYVLDKATSWIKSKVSDLVGGLVGGGGGGGSTGAGGVGTYDGKPVDNWIIPILQWAASHGWSGSVTSGYRNPAQQMAAAEGYGLDKYGPGGPLASNHTKTQYPGGAVDVTNAAQLAQVLQGYPGSPNLVWGGPVIGDQVHFSATGHYRGGIIGKLPRFAGAFAAGGAVTANGPTLALFGENGPETAMFIPGYASGTNNALGATISINNPKGVPSKTGAAVALPSMASITGEPKLPKVPKIPTSGTQSSLVGGAMKAQGTITALRAQIDGLEHQYSIIDQFYNLSGTPNFVDPNTGALDENAIHTRLAQLDNLIKYRQKIFDTWSQVVVWTEALVTQNQKIVNFLKRKLASTRAMLTRLRNTLKAIKTKGLKGNALKSAQKHQKDTKAAIDKYQKIEGTTSSDLAKYTGNLASAQGDLTSGKDDRDNAWISVLTEQAERTSVAATKAQPIVDTTVDTSTALDTSSAVTDTTGTATAAAAVQDPRVPLMQTLLTQAQQATAVSQAQYSVLQNFQSSMPPFGGSFADGGVVPGPTGAPRIILAHGGEQVLSNNQTAAAPEVHLHFASGMEWLQQFVQVQISQSGRQDSRMAMRALPGARAR